ncbi:REP-associated tyrosine transposase [Alkaliphilus peptidifermentans]|uniref:REP element-mobilizing transposase RayT n=1 Tax=Alkaliphilus peptidifermentans DSM 18978 TaxID=1120976 RepID=A0A1G5KZB4_9FIRM|nr:transposase [Alkaliphilus peptidifermentans]SCZ05962.1 REP element-mobilizing transposase RayT [Alkaliphilus peptidifermentans DSM 18978]
MPRQAREKSESGIYHIMLRGTNRQEIFHDDEDCQRFIETLAKYKQKSDIKVYGWCLMGNHVHLLIGEGKEELPRFMKRIGVSYVWYYNRKYKTTGHLFQDRYKSEKVESDEYLLAVVRYIHQNPVKAGIAKTPGEWKWSSCQSYYRKKPYPVELLDMEYILCLFSEDLTTALRRFIEYNEEENRDSFLDDTDKKDYSDEEARVEIGKMIAGYEIAQVKALSKAQRDEIVAKVKKIEGLTQRQISRILGISLSLVNRA